MKYFEVESSEVPLHLLLEADPSESSIRSYASGSRCFVAKDEHGETVAACILKEIAQDVIELFNIAVCPHLQSQGIGSKLLQYVIQKIQSTHIKRIELGTGTFGHQLTFYQRQGFRVDSIVKDHFTQNYPQPIYENGIQHQDMLRLYLNL